MAKQKNQAPNNTEEEYRQLVKVAKLYYQYDFTQGEIATRLGFSRVKIHRMLRAAKDMGIVKIQINTGSLGYVDFENQLMVKYNLRDVIIVPSQVDKSDQYLSLARGAIEWLSPQLASGIKIGLGLGRTISHLPQVFESSRQIDCTFAEIVGAASDHSQGFAPYNITSRMAEIVGGKAEFFYAPTYVSSPELKKSLVAEPSIQRSLERARECDIVIQSIGPVDQSALLYVHGLLTDKGLQELRDIGAVGDALGHYFDANGQEVEAAINQLVIGIDLEDLRRISWSVLIAGGEEKEAAIDAALKGELFNVLITDTDTADNLLQEND
jgi:deoxyribonucleoside regulator